MNYEEKYKEALERAKKMLASKRSVIVEKQALETIFPELAESEDERIRKDLIHWVKTNISYERMPVGMNYSNECVLAWLEKQGAQNPTADKVEPKFQKGQWIVWLNKCYKVNYNGCGYELIDQTGLRTSLEYGTVDASAHLWTIEDAKDGDVLACVDKASCCPFIFHNLTEELNPRSYCGVNTVHQFQVNDENGGYWCRSDEAIPATKEQRELLFAKMKEAGYEWDADKKELKKIEQEPAWSEEDEILHNQKE